MKKSVTLQVACHSVALWLCFRITDLELFVRHVSLNKAIFSHKYMFTYILISFTGKPQRRRHRLSAFNTFSLLSYILLWRSFVGEAAFCYFINRTRNVCLLLLSRILCDLLNIILLLLEVYIFPFTS